MLNRFENYLATAGTSGQFIARLVLLSVMAIGVIAAACVILTVAGAK